MDVSIIIVNYNTKELTVDCIRSIYAAENKYSFEIYLVDNNSSDGSVEAVREKFPEVKVISNKLNAGFSKANNQAIRLASGRYTLLLNSDTIVKNRSIDTMISYMDSHQDVGASGCKVTLPDGKLDKACHRGFPTPSASMYYFLGLDERFPNNPRFNGYHLNHLDFDQIHEIDCLVGAFMIVRREAIKEVGMLDEEYFMYGEDIDWCFRIKNAGWKITYNPEAEIIHYKGASSRKKPIKIVYEFHRAMYLFHKKNLSFNYSKLVNLIVVTGIAAKLGLALMKNLIKNN
ncbi:MULTISPECIES: glycosyltransferase family 2 protein [Bacillaceae]|uniref:glycosyltransferase family 2 protein n=1 Tax=Bacillaceae TaxID=186817 RepID=UPI002963D10F|nr:glycosyltransferase family 2 protein [Bacillus infantis]MDW2876426.1 glycosyltransferase family 2 protein [Bacillus infantis]